MAKKPEATPEIVERCIALAVRNLKAANCQFAIITPSGEKLGELTIVRNGGGKGSKRFHFKQTGYVDKVKAMEVGDVLEFSAPEGVPIEHYRSAITSAASKTFGAGSTMSHIKDGAIVEVMRVA